jgi:hypothetical protein
MREARVTGIGRPPRCLDKEQASLAAARDEGGGPVGRSATGAMPVLASESRARPVWDERARCCQPVRIRVRPSPRRAGPISLEVGEAPLSALVPTSSCFTVTGRLAGLWQLAVPKISLPRTGRKRACEGQRPRARDPPGHAAHANCADNPIAFEVLLGPALVGLPGPGPAPPLRARAPFARRGGFAEGGPLKFTHDRR